MISKPKSVLVLTGSLVLGIGMATGVLAATDDSDPQPTRAPHLVRTMADGRPVDSITKSWPKNEFGLTVGSATLADRDTMNIPDLTPMTADNGREGFVRTDEMIFPMPRSPKEAAEQTRSRLNENGEDIRTVYGPDGKSVLGTVLIATVTQGDEANQSD